MVAENEALPEMIGTAKAQRQKEKRIKFFTPKLSA
jgi:hypothetical protein